MRCHLILPVALILFQTSAISQRARELPSDTLAVVGGTVIQARELIERLELMPWPGKERAGRDDSVKIKALQSLVAERLLSLEAQARGLGRDPGSILRESLLERTMVRDELYRREVSPAASPTAAEMKEGLKRNSSTVTVFIATARSREGAETIYETVRRLPLDSALQVLPVLLILRTDTLTFNFGDVEKPLENAAYGIARVGGTAPPVFIPRLGWGVVSLLRRIPNTAFLSQSVAERNRRVANTVRRTKELEIAGKFSGSILSAKRAEADSAGFELLAEASLRILRGDSTNLRKQGVFNLGIIADTLERMLATRLDDRLVQMDEGGLSFHEVIEGFRTRPFGFPTLNDDDFRNRLNGAIRDLAGAEYLAREGMRRGIQHSPRVRQDVRTWTDYWQSRVMERILRDSVRIDDEDVSAYLIEHGGILGLPYEVNIQEILSDSVATAVRLMERVLNGEEIGMLAKEYSRRRGWAERGGESLWFRVSGFPEIGFRALEAEIGSLVGPVSVRNGYSIFRVLGKRRAAGDTLISYDSLKALTRQRVTQEKTTRFLNTRLADLARVHGTTIRYDRLRRIEITRQNMVTRRMIGFGGVMVAVPTIVPQFNWIQRARDLKSVLP